MLTPCILGNNCTYLPVVCRLKNIDLTFVRGPNSLDPDSPPRFVRSI